MADNVIAYKLRNSPDLGTGSKVKREEKGKKGLDKTDKTWQRIPLDGEQGMNVYNIKAFVFKQHALNSADIDLVLLDILTGEEYKYDDTPIPQRTSLSIKQRPYHPYHSWKASINNFFECNFQVRLISLTNQLLHCRQHFT